MLYQQGGRFVRLLVVLCALIISAPLLAEEPGGLGAVPDLLARAPEDALLSVALPGFESVASVIDFTMSMNAVMSFLPSSAGGVPELLKDVTSGLNLPEVGSVKELTDALGMEGQRPVGLSLRSFDQPAGVFFIPLRDADLFLKQTGLGVQEETEMSINGEVCRAGVNPSEDAAYLVCHDYVLISNSMENLGWAAKAFGAPRAISYGSEALPVLRGGEWVASTNLAEVGRYLRGNPELAILAPVADSLSAQFDSVLAGWHMTPESMTLRVAGHAGVSATAPVPGPLALPSLLPAKPLVLVALRTSDGLLDFLRTTAIAVTGGGAQAAQLDGAFGLARGVLGEEVALAIVNVSADELRAVGVVQTTNAAMIEGLVSMAGLIQEEGAIAGQTYKSISGLPAPVAKVYFTSTPTLFVFGTAKEDLQQVTDRSKGAATDLPAAVFDAGLMARANHGIVAVNNLRLSQVAGETNPLAFRGKTPPQDTVLTVEQHPTWSQVAIDAPNAAMALPAIMLPALTSSRESARRAASQNNLKQMGLVFKMYSNEAKDQLFPALSSKPGCLMAEASAIYPEYLTDPTILVNPRSGVTPDTGNMTTDNALAMINDGHYLYLSHAVLDEEQGMAYVAAYRKAMESGGGFNADIETPTGTLYRLREGVERALIQEKDLTNPAASALYQSYIPIMFERPLPDIAPDGINVLFMDGHVEFIRKGTFPYTDRFMNALLALDALGDDTLDWWQAVPETKSP